MHVIYQRCQYPHYSASMIGWLMIVEQLMELKLAGETEILGETRPQWHFDYNKSHMAWRRFEPHPPLSDAANKRLSYDTVRNRRSE
jgi:hypothetical protein